MAGHIRSMALALLIALIALGVVLLVPNDNPRPKAPPATVVTSANNKQVAVPKAQLEQAAKNPEDTHLGNDAATPAQLQSSNHANPAAPSVTGAIPLASPFQPGCLTRSNTVNFSYRNGTKPSIIPLHLTVSPNVAGWNDVDGVWGFLNRSSTQASANYIVDGEGHCVYAVSESYKAWAQANLNSASACAIEVINTGNESVYIQSAGLLKLARIVHDCAHRWHIPLRLASVSNGYVLRSGVIDHFHLGSAGGGHVDIHNFGAGCRNQGAGANTVLCVETVLAAARALDGPPPVPLHRTRQCQELTRIRGVPHKTAGQRRRAQFLKHDLNAHGFKCRADGTAVR